MSCADYYEITNGEVIEQIVDYAIREGTEKTLSSNWIVTARELSDLTAENIDKYWLRENANRLMTAFWARKEILDVYISPEDEEIDIILGISYCKLIDDEEDEW